MKFLGAIRLQSTKPQAAYFTNDTDGAEYRLVYGDPMTEQTATEAAFELAKDLQGRRVAFDGEMSDVGGTTVRVETALLPSDRVPVLNEKSGMMPDDLEQPAIQERSPSSH